MPAVCEVCGTSCATGELLLCANATARHRIGCHTFCLPGPQHTSYTCTSCLEGAADQGRRPKRTAAAAAAGAAAGAVRRPGGRHAAAQRAGADWVQLPEEVLELVLQHVPLQHRLSSCALVSTAWAAAAAASVDSLTFSAASAAHFQVVWPAVAAKYAAQLTSLTLQVQTIQCSWWGPPNLIAPLQQLPGTQLRELSLQGFCLQLTQAGSAGAGSCLQAGGAPAAIPPCLDGVTCLALQEVHLAGEAPGGVLGAFSALQHLCSLQLRKVLCPGDYIHSSLSEKLSELSSVSGLTRLQLGDTHAIPQQGCLALLPALHTLEVDSCSISTEGEPEQLPELREVSWQVSRCQYVNFAAQLLWVQQQQQLTSLRVCDQRDSRHPGLLWGPASAYQALTASSKLRQLDLQGMSGPAGAWDHMLPPGRTLLQLTSFQLQFKLPTKLTASQQQQLVAACPALQRLQLSVRAKYVRDGSWLRLQQLQALTALTCLAFDGARHEDVPLLVQLTGLRQLHLLDRCWVSDTAVQELSTLQQLTQLRAESRSFSKFLLLALLAGPDSSRQGYWCGELVCRSQSDLPVWRQLLECCQRAAEAKQEAAAEQQAEREAGAVELQQLAAAQRQVADAVLPKGRKGYALRQRGPGGARG